jgi:hypothetical protein
MASMTTTFAHGRTRKPAAAPHGTCRLSVTINGTSYSARPVTPADLGFGLRRAWTLRRSGADPITVTETIEGPVTCECGDYEWRRAGLTDRPCKHGAALRALGLIGGTR